LLDSRPAVGVGACTAGVKVCPLARVVEVGVVVGEGRELGGLGDDVAVCEVFVFFSLEDVDFGGAAADAGGRAWMVRTWT